MAPSDSEGDVGPDQYVEWVNCVIQIFDKRGHTLFGPMDGNTLFAGFGGACESAEHGDPIVLYDRQADRWLLGQFAIPAGGPSHECLAVSQTANPTGGYFRYDFVWPGNKVNDYCKLGVWPDAWYMTANQFDQAFTRLPRRGRGRLQPRPRCSAAAGSASTWTWLASRRARSGCCRPT